MDICKNYRDILNSIDGFLVIDTNEKIVYMADNLLKQLSIKTMDEVIGKNIRDVIPTNKAYRILRTGKKQIGQMYFVEGYTIVSNGYPIYKDGKLAGAFEYDAFSNIGFVEGFLEQVENMRKNETASIKRRSNEHIMTKYSIDDIKGSSPAIKRLKEDIKIAAKSGSTVLITGETGSGKELVAHAIHKLSQRSLFHFVSLNCAAIPNELFESELFGYEEGSFTGARKGGKFGKVEIASNGTLFLDEIDNLTLGMQAKILRFLQEKEIYRVGGDFAIPVNTRVIAATNQDPELLVHENKMRKDLYYRLNVIEIKVPPLRERLDDIPEIARNLVKNLSDTPERGVKTIETINPKVYDMLMQHQWPGNIRELSNVLERAVNRCYERELKPEHFAYFRQDQGQAQNSAAISLGKSLKEIKDEAEACAIQAALDKYNGNVTKAAEELGISRQMLHRKLREKDHERKQKVTDWRRV
ncbi:MAG: sigma 54-interacting transcriptional regulator [Firmicutes bacterium]|nr:sigma 54-interacting transcriptional regulator [Bacillota bacterium]NBI61949.1 AAA family ATPase [Clostridiales bacterium]